MKYSIEVLIDLPREEVIKKFKDPDNIVCWQRGFISMKTLQGNLGEEGSKNELKLKIENREIEMIETIIKNNLPQEFHASYTAKGLYNLQENFFDETPAHKTRWITHNEFKFSGFMKLIGLFMPGAFRKQTQQTMEDFKAFAETGIKVKN